MKKVILLIGITFLLGLSGCNKNDDPKDDPQDEPQVDTGECRPMFS